MNFLSLPNSASARSRHYIELLLYTRQSGVWFYFCTWEYGKLAVIPHVIILPYLAGLVNMTGLEGAESHRSRRRGGRRLGQVIVHFIRTLVLILSYYTCSIGLTFYQKRLFKVRTFACAFTVYPFISSSIIIIAMFQ